MPSKEWHDPKTWIEGEKLKADEVNEQFTDNLTWLYEKNFDVAQLSGVSDFQVTSTTPVPAGTLACVIRKYSDETVVRVSFSGNAYHGSASAFIRFDVLVDGSYYASSGTSTPATGGLMSLQQDTANLSNQISMEAFIPDIDAGTHTFYFVWWVAAGTGTMNVTNTIAQFSVEEYGVADVNII